MPTKTLKDVIEHLSTTLDNAKPQRVQQVVLSLLDDELIKDASFLKLIRERYLALSEATFEVKKSSERIKRKRPGDVVLNPVGNVPGFVFEPNEPPNLAVLTKMYGIDQLSLALSRYSVPRLKKAVQQLAERHGAMPSTKDELIACLVAASAQI